MQTMSTEKTTTLSILVGIAAFLAELIFRDILSSSTIGVILSVVLAAIILCCTYFVVDGIQSSVSSARKKEENRKREYDEKLYRLLNKRLSEIVKMQKAARGEETSNEVDDEGQELSVMDSQESFAASEQTLSLGVSNEERDRLLESINENIMKSAKLIVKYNKKGQEQSQQLTEQSVRDLLQAVKQVEQEIQSLGQQISNLPVSSSDMENERISELFAGGTLTEESILPKENDLSDLFITEETEHFSLEEEKLEELTIPDIVEEKMEELAVPDIEEEKMEELTVPDKVEEKMEELTVPDIEEEKMEELVIPDIEEEKTEELTVSDMEEEKTEEQTVSDIIEENQKPELFSEREPELFDLQEDILTDLLSARKEMQEEESETRLEDILPADILKELEEISLPTEETEKEDSLFTVGASEEQEEIPLPLDESEEIQIPLEESEPEAVEVSEEDQKEPEEIPEQPQENLTAVELLKIKQKEKEEEEAKKEKEKPEPVAEENDTNGIMSAEDIAALFASTNGES